MYLCIYTNTYTHTHLYVSVCCMIQSTVPCVHTRFAMCTYAYRHVYIRVSIVGKHVAKSILHVKVNVYACVRVFI